MLKINKGLKSCIKRLDKSSDNPSQIPEKVKGPSHGDELAYIFEPLDANGQPMGGQISSTDAKVRENFVGLISQFAHGLDKAGKKNSINIFGTLPFSTDTDQFLKITDKITVDKDFRFCQIGLWGNMADRLTGELCKNLLGNLLNLAQVPGKLPGQLTQGLPGQLTGALGGQGQSPLNNVLPGAGQGPLTNGQIPNSGPLNNVPLIPGLLSQSTRAPQRQPQRPQRKTTKSYFKIPFDF